MKARRLSRDRYLILEQEYDRDVEAWASEPGTVVECRRELRNGRQLVIAVRAVEGKSGNSSAQERTEPTSGAVPPKGRRTEG